MNTLGRVFRCTTWGESHGEAMGCIVDGCPAGLELTESDIKNELVRDIPNSILGTPRKEANRVKIFSGTYLGKTIGTPICVVVYNDIHNSADYEYMKYLYRPGHAEYTYHKRYGIYNPYGGGRASGRECVVRLAAGAIAKKLLLAKGIVFESSVLRLAGVECSTESFTEAKEKCLEISSQGDTSGGIVALSIKGVPAGVGSPVFDKLHALIMYAISTIGGVKGVESGMGFEAARMTGSEMNDPYGLVDDEIMPLTNNAGGVLGGISTGLELNFRIAVKPTPSVAVPQQTVNWKTKQEEELLIKGRFDKNFTPRVGPIAESMAALVLVDQMILSGYINPIRVD